MSVGLAGFCMQASIGGIRVRIPPSPPFKFPEPAIANSNTTFEIAKTPTHGVLIGSDSLQAEYAPSVGGTVAWRQRGLSTGDRRGADASARRRGLLIGRPPCALALRNAKAHAFASGGV